MYLWVQLFGSVILRQGFGSTECSLQRARFGRLERESKAEEVLASKHHHKLYATCPPKALPVLGLGFKWVPLQICMHPTYTHPTYIHVRHVQLVCRCSAEDVQSAGM
jgi:hypothetical protein